MELVNEGQKTIAGYSENRIRRFVDRNADQLDTEEDLGYRPATFCLLGLQIRSPSGAFIFDPCDMLCVGG